VGIASAYEWIREKLLRSLNSYSSEVKNRLAAKYAEKFETRADLPELLKEWVIEEIKPFNPEAVPELEKEFLNYEARRQADPFKRYLQRVIRWATDRAGISRIRRRLDELSV